MNPYENQYRQLIANGAVAWAGEGYIRAKKQQEKIFHWLNLHHYLPRSGAPVLEMGCGNGAMASQSLAERGYSVWGVDFLRLLSDGQESVFSKLVSPHNFCRKCLLYTSM